MIDIELDSIERKLNSKIYERIAMLSKSVDDNPDNLVRLAECNWFLVMTEKLFNSLRAQDAI